MLTFNGHDLSGTTAQRPTNADVGQPYFDTTIGKSMVFNGSAWQDNTSASDATAPGVNGLSSTLKAGAGYAGSGTTPGSNGGAMTVRPGAGGSKADTGHAVGGNAGALNFTGQNGGNTASNGSDAGGNGSTVTVTSGNGGNATAGTGNGGNAGNLNFALGTGGTSAGGNAGANGQLQVNGVSGMFQQDFVYGEATPLDQCFMVAMRPLRVLGITVRPLVVGSDGGAVTAVAKKVASGTAISGGTALHSGNMDFKGAINTNQSLTLSTTSSDLDVAAGNAIGIDVTGVMTAARGVISILFNPQ